MNLVNATGLVAGYTLGIQPDGRELLVVVVKGTFMLPARGEEPSLAEDQQPLVETDEFTGEPGFSAPLYEIDFARRNHVATYCLMAAPTLRTANQWSE